MHAVGLGGGAGGVRVCAVQDGLPDVAADEGRFEQRSGSGSAGISSVRGAINIDPLYASITDGYQSRTASGTRLPRLKVHRSLRSFFSTTINGFLADCFRCAFDASSASARVPAVQGLVLAPECSLKTAQCVEGGVANWSLNRVVGTVAHSREPLVRFWLRGHTSAKLNPIPVTYPTARSQAI